MISLRPSIRLSILTALLFSLLILTLFSNAQAHDPLHAGRQHVHDSGKPTESGLARKTILNKSRQRVLAFRQTGDDRNLDIAWADLSSLLERQEADAMTLVTAAFVAQSRHEFEGAIRLLDRALTIDDRNDEAWLLHASIHLVLGNVDSADRACRQLRDVPPLIVLTCKARIAEANGEYEAAQSRLTELLRIAESQQLPFDVLAWSYSVAGDLAVGAGDLERAETMYRRSLDFAERTQVRAALVDVLLWSSNYEAAWQALRSGSTALPLLVRRMITASKLGRLHELQDEVSTVQHKFLDWIAEKDWLHAREMTRFFIDVVDEPQLARRLALINLKLQREPEDRRLELRTREDVGSAPI